ncbi:MAG: CocE/NonD family hydrolase [Alphaproteobacteria bacterium]|nr:CocE/NonD family hydrolase [Alphaproteobacteria bacterium]
MAGKRLRTFRHPNVVVSKVPQNVHADWNVPVRVRDGTILRVNVYRPAEAGSFPVIMSAHPYGKDHIPAHSRSGRTPNFQFHLFPQPEPISISEWTSWEAPDPAVWVPRGYIVVNADLRGGGTSEGTADLFSDQEAEDYYDLIEWAGVQPWSNGRVGLDGVSYLSISQYKVAALNPPRLAAICPWEGFSDLYRDFARPGGAREDGFSIIWSKGTRHAARVHGDIRREICARPERDAWYQSRTPDIERIQVPMLVCGSFSDHSLHSRGSFEVFRRAASPKKWLYTHRGGKWSTYYSQRATAARHAFFDHFLKGEENGWDQRPPVHLEIYDGGPEPTAVVHEDSWPPTNLRWRTLGLDMGAMTLAEEPLANASELPFSSRSVLRFRWTVPESMDIIGPMAMRIWLRTKGARDLTLFVGVRKFRAGVEVGFEGSYGYSGDIVSKGWQRVAHRELDNKLSTLAQPVHTHARAELLSTGDVVPVDIALQQHATRFLKGDVLQLDLRGTWHFPRNPLFGQFPAFYSASPKGKWTLLSGDKYDSWLLMGSRAVPM